MSILRIVLSIIVSESIAAFSPSVSAMSWTKYDSLNVKIDDIIAPLSDYIISTKSILECLRVCSVSNTCLSVLYNDEDKLCRINNNIVCFETDAVIPYLTSKWTLLYSQQTSWRIGTTTTTTTTTIAPTTGEVTSTTSPVQTTVATTTAVSTLSSQTTAAPFCQSCSDYGSEFFVYRGMVLIGADEVSFLSFASCEAACLAQSNFTCRSFSYFTAYTQCHQHADISCERPTDYVAIADYDHYERKCLGM